MLRPFQIASTCFLALIGVLNFASGVGSLRLLLGSVVAWAMATFGEDFASIVRGDLNLRSPRYAGRFISALGWSFLLLFAAITLVFYLRKWGYRSGVV